MDTSEASTLNEVSVTQILYHLQKKYLKQVSTGDKFSSFQQTGVWKDGFTASFVWLGQDTKKKKSCFHIVQINPDESKNLVLHAWPDNMNVEASAILGKMKSLQSQPPHGQLPGRPTQEWEEDR